MDPIKLSGDARVYFRVPNFTGYGPEFDTHSEAVAYAVESHHSPYTRRFVDIRVSDSQGDRPVARQEIPNPFVPQPVALTDSVKTEKMLEDWRQADEWTEHLRSQDETLHGLGDFDGGGC